MDANGQDWNMAFGKSWKSLAQCFSSVCGKYHKQDGSEQKWPLHWQFVTNTWNTLGRIFSRFPKCLLFQSCPFASIHPFTVFLLCCLTVLSYNDNLISKGIPHYHSRILNLWLGSAYMYYWYCAYVLRILRYLGFLWVVRFKTRQRKQSLAGALGIQKENWG